MFENLFLIHLRAVKIFAALILFLQSPKTGAAKTESYKDIIEKSYNLSLQKERNQAISLLVSAFKKESKKNLVANKELKEALEQIATVFYTEKAQQMYELANSVAITDVNLALNQLREANKIEPENLIIESANIRLMMASGDCSGAEKRVEKWLDILNMSETVALLHGQVKICNGKFEDYRKIKNSIDLKNSNYFQIWQLSEAEVLNKQGQFQKSLDLLNETEQMVTTGVSSQNTLNTGTESTTGGGLKGSNKNITNGSQNSISSAGANSALIHPDIFYWKYKNNIELKQNSDFLGLKYVNSCKSLSQRSIQMFSYYPFLCKKTSEVEAAIKASK